MLIAGHQVALGQPAEAVQLTPRDAAALLATIGMTGDMVCAFHGPDSATKIDTFAEAMRTGQWRGTSRIVVDDSGNLLDGLHRLRAMVRTGVSIQVDIAMTTYA